MLRTRWQVAKEIAKIALLLAWVGVLIRVALYGFEGLVPLYCWYFL